MHRLYRAYPLDQRTEGGNALKSAVALVAATESAPNLLWESPSKLHANTLRNCLQGLMLVNRSQKRSRQLRSLIPSHIPSWSTLRRPVIRLVLPHLIKSASFSWPMKDCLQPSALGLSKILSVGGDARCKIRRSGVTTDVGFVPIALNEDDIV